MSYQFLHLQHRDAEYVPGGAAGTDQGHVPFECDASDDDPQPPVRQPGSVKAGRGDYGPDVSSGELATYPAVRPHHCRERNG